MTGNELSAARKGAGLTQQALADLCQVHWQVVGGWERKKDEDVRAGKGKDLLDQYYKCMSAIHDFLNHAQLAAKADEEREGTYVPTATIPAPCSYHYIDKGEPLILSDAEAAAGDLICLYNGTEFYDICRVQPTRQFGEFVAIDSKGVVDQVPPYGQYKVIDYALHKYHIPHPDAATSATIGPEDSLT